MKKIPTFALILNYLMLLEILIACIILISKIWITDDANQLIANRVILSDIILFITGLILYWLMYYKSNHE